MIIIIQVKSNQVWLCSLSPGKRLLLQVLVGVVLAVVVVVVVVSSLLLFHLWDANKCWQWWYKPIAAVKHMMMSRSTHHKMSMLRRLSIWLRLYRGPLLFIIALVSWPGLDKTRSHNLTVSYTPPQHTKSTVSPDQENRTQVGARLWQTLVEKGVSCVSPSISCQNVCHEKSIKVFWLGNICVEFKLYC